MLMEANWMRKMGLGVPEAVHTLAMANVKETYAQLKVALMLMVMPSFNG